MKNIKKIKTSLLKKSVDMNDFVGDENEFDTDEEVYPVTMISEETAKLSEQEVGMKITNETDGNYGFGGMYEFDNGAEEYYIFDSYDEAEQVAVQYVREMMNEPEMFNMDFLRGYIDNEKLTRDLWYDEQNYFYDTYNEMTDEELKQAVGFEEPDTDYYDEAESLMEDEIVEFDREDAIQELIDEKESTFDGVEYLEDIYGSNWQSEFSNIENYIDYDEASEDAVNIDGVAHFLAGYDGNEIDLPNGGVMYRYN